MDETLPHSQIRPLHRGTAGLIFRDKCPIALNGHSGERESSRAAQPPEVPVLPWVPVCFHDGASNAPTASHEDFGREELSRGGSGVVVRSSSWAFCNHSDSAKMAVRHDLSFSET